MKRFKTGDTLFILDPFLRKTAPKGKDKLTIIRIENTGWVYVEFKDGVSDYIMLSQLHNHWGHSVGERTKLWKVINDG